MLGYNDLLSRPSIEMNTIWEPIIKRLDKKKNLNMSADKKIIHNSSKPTQVRILTLYVPIIHSKLSCRTHSVTVVGVRSTKLLRRQSCLQMSNNTGILNTCTRLRLTESKDATLVDSIKNAVRSSV